MSGLGLIGVSSVPNTRIDHVRHPHFVATFPDFHKFRTVFEGGRHFIQRYLIKFSARESDGDFANRKKISYAPAHAKAAMADIVRRGGPQSYHNAILGQGRGVDLRGNSMNSFLGRIILPELLVLGRVGVFIDKPPIPENSTLKGTKTLQPYLYWYSAEDIRSWHFNEINELDAVLLEDHFFARDENGLISSESTRFRLMTLEPGGGVKIRFFAFTGDVSKNASGPQELFEEEVVLDLERIPFVILELSHSLLQDVADYQIALLNLASSDVNYALKSNFPFYTEQRSATSTLPHMIPQGTEGTAKEGGTAKNQSIAVGATQGRSYPKGLDRPEFIHPSPEPLLASMQKQQQMINEIRQLINLALSNVKPVRASAESKQIDNQGLEAGLSYIGLELQWAEQEIAKIWADYEKSDEIAHIKYPDNYQLRTDKDRRDEAKELEALKDGTPSATYKKEICKQIARVALGAKLPPDILETIEKEIDASVVVETDSETVRNDLEAGLVSNDTASQIRGYPEGEAEKAKVDQAERLALIAAAQSSAATNGPMAARGVPDADANPGSGVDEKTLSRQTDDQATTADRTRGEGQ
jgi:hypothetical protein